MKKYIFCLLISFSFSMLCAQVPLNDDCVNATLLPVNIETTCVQSLQGDFTGATLSSNPTLFSNINKDIWYKFTAKANKHKFIFRDLTAPLAKSEYALIEIYQGSCNNLSSYNYFFGSDSLSTTFDFDINKEYFLRISALDNSQVGQSPLSTFSLCAVSLPPPAVNHLCSGATALTIPTNGTPVAVSGNNEFSQPVLLQSNFCFNSFNEEKSLWYSFTAQQESYKFLVNNITKQAGSFDDYYRLRIYEGSGCDSLSTVFCKSHSKNITGAPTVCATIKER